jgi:uncharacterized Fe-S cluster protein YjdI
VSRRLQVYTTPQITVTFDPTRCIHHAHCVRTLPAVFNTAARPWVQPEHADTSAVLAAVAGCPTGALHAERPDGITADTPGASATPAMQVVRNGPLYLRGSVRLVDGDDAPIAEDARVALCRCGLSTRKPFCDNSHRGARWTDSPAP